MGVHLFAGAGGMALGLESAGFRKSLFYEVDSYAYGSLQRNGLIKEPAPQWEEHKGDVRKVDWKGIRRPIDLLAGGVPCQPFSLAGKHLAERDGRNLFPEFFRAARSLRPKAMFVENVAGLARQSFQPYFQYILRQMELPSLAPRLDELWQDHDARLRQHQASAGYLPEYHVASQTVDAADFGVPQRRRRVFLIATRTYLSPYKFPDTTHSRAALVRTQESGEYWESLGLSPLGGTRRSNESPDGKLPWVTVRQALATLPDPATSEQEAEANHWFIPGAKIYKGHTGSPLDWPSKTLKAGVHGVPGGENTLVEDDGRVRYYTLREAARIQTFPDSHFFHGARLHVTRQIGNAVPCLLAEALARPLRKILEGRSS